MRKKRAWEKEKEEKKPTPFLLLPFLFCSEGDEHTTELRASGLTLRDIHLNKRQNNLKKKYKKDNNYE